MYLRNCTGPFRKNVSVRDIVASGLLDTVGLYVKPPKEKMPLCDFWMDMFGIGGIAEKMFLRISSGEQRLALLARAFVKGPAAAHTRRTAARAGYLQQDAYPGDNRNFLQEAGQDTDNGNPLSARAALVHRQNQETLIII